MVRAISGFLGGGAGILGTLLGAYFAFTTLTDAQKALYGWVLFGLGIVAIIALATFCVSEIRRDHKTDRKFEDITKLLERLASGKSGGQTVKATGIVSGPGTFRKQVFELVSEIRRLVRSRGANPSEEDEFNISTDYALQLAKQVRAARIRWQNLYGYNDTVRELIRTLPLGNKNLLRIADLLEKLVPKIGDDVPEAPLVDDNK